MTIAAQARVPSGRRGRLRDRAARPNSWQGLGLLLDTIGLGTVIALLKRIGVGGGRVIPDGAGKDRMITSVEEILRTTGAMMEGHFLLTSGLHSSIYWEKFRVLQYPHYTERLCRLIAEHFQSQAVQMVAGPTTGGVILAYEVARQLGIRSIYAEKQGEARVFRRGFTISPGERTLVVDDVLTTGGSLRDVISEVRRSGGEVIGAAVLIDRSQTAANLGVPLFGCYRTAAPSYKPEDCPLCAAGEPLQEPGRGQG